MVVRKSTISFTILFISLILVCQQSFASSKRYALVIGNSSYTSAPLDNPKNDAQDMSQVLLEAGFEVDLLVDANQKQMERSIKSLGKKLRNGGTGLFYFAGHGVQVNNLNYLIPVDAEIDTEADVKFEAVDANRVMAQMQEAGNGVNMVFLDACRNNPYSRSFRSAENGLAQMDSPVGSLVAFATAPGSVASDGSGRNGVYTKHLIEMIKKPGLELGRLMRQVRSNVRKETSGKQTPFELSSLEGDFYFFNSGDKVKQTVVSTSQIKSPSSMSAEEEMWQEVKNSRSAKYLQAYLKAYPAGKHVHIAQIKLDKLKGTENIIIPKPDTLKPTRQARSTYKDPTTGMEFVLVKGGCYQMGQTKQEKNALIREIGQVKYDKYYKRELPRHEVCVDDFYMGKYEVTQGQYKKIMGKNPASFKKGENYPVEEVSWNDVQRFIKKLNSKTSKPFRLPTEAEWEYAAKSGGKSETYAGSNSPDSVVWYRDNSGKFTHPVGTKQANGLGIYDMSGNVWEWCNGWFDEDYYSSSPRNNPQGPGTTKYRVIRGGSWSSVARGVRTASRDGDEPGNRNDRIGFRLLLQAL